MCIYFKNLKISPGLEISVAVMLFGQVAQNIKYYFRRGFLCHKK